jgi:hypothetical protein
MSLRIGFDMDGVLADFASAYRAVERDHFGHPAATPIGHPEDEPSARDEDDDPPPRRPLDNLPTADDRRRRDVIWNTIQSTADFWTTLAPIGSGAVRRLHALMLQHRWEVFFISQRPATAGDTVQRQTQHWLVKQGFDLPSVLVIPGSRGAAAGALRLDYHVDDSLKNCMDVKADSTAKSLLIVDSSDELTIAKARRLGIGTAPGIDECLAILDQASRHRSRPTLFHRLAQFVGWR